MMRNRLGTLRSLGGATVVAAFMLSAPAAAPASESPGPAFVEELAGQLQPLRTIDPGDVREAREADVSIARGRVLVDVYVSGRSADALARLRDLGMEVIATGDEPLAVVEGYLPLGSIAAAARLEVTTATLPVVAPIAEVGAKESQGVASHNLPAAISAAGTSGAGIDVGIISDSIDQVNGGVDDSQATGDLPPDPRVVVLLDDADPASTDEGRAMAEIIYDEAPGLNRILFNTGFLGAASKADAIDRLVLNGARVIADDITYLTEPFFQDGLISQAADRAKAAGVAYFVSAGNRGRQSYESVYRSGGGGLHDFDPSDATDTRSSFSGTVPMNGNIRLFFQWDEPWGGASTDLNIRIVNAATGALLNPPTQGVTNNVATGIPSEAVSFTNPGPPVQVAVEIIRVAGTRDPFMKWVEADNFGPTPVPQFDTQSQTLNPEAASARGTMTVAAVPASDPGLDTPEPFSSRGPVVRLFDTGGNRLAVPDVRFKPNLAAADAVSTTVPGFDPFLGTSAAAPSAAGIAAVLRSANPSATVNEIYAQMSDPLNAIDCSSSAIVPDPDCGAGFILADRAALALDRTPARPVAVTMPSRPNGKGGWYTTRHVRLSWQIDPESPTESSTGCEPVTIKKDGVRRLSCSALSGGGPGTGTARIKHDTKKPSKPKIKGVKPGRPLPAKGKIKCRSRDATSGIKSCKIRGYTERPGKHKLRATATDRAGLKSKSALTYRVR